MVDPAGVAIGLGGILLAFKGIVDTVNLFDLILAKDNGSRHLAMRYYVERHKTILWGDEFQPDNKDSPLLNESDATRRLIAGVLAELLAVHQLAVKYIKRHDLIDASQIAKGDSTTAIGMQSSFVQNMRLVRDTQRQKNTLLWGSQSKGKFSELVDRMTNLNDDLHGLVHGSSTRALAAAISSSLLPQIKDTINLVAIQQTANFDPLLKISARLKEIQLASDQHAGPKSSIKPLDEVFTSTPGHQHLDRPVGIFQDELDQQQAWIEWIRIPGDVKPEHRKLIQTRCESLAAMLALAKHAEFRVPPFLALVEDINQSEGLWRKFGFVFGVPLNQSITNKGLMTLERFVSETQDAPPVLEKRYGLAYKLASSIWLIHGAKWIHKGIRSQNICLFNDSEGQIDVSHPNITGFEYSRPEDSVSLKDRVRGIPEVDIYYHPDVPSKGFNRMRDIYSLGVVLLEISTWRPLSQIIEISTQKQLGDMTISQYRSTFLDCLPMVGSRFGSSYRDAVHACLTGNLDLTDSSDDGEISRAFFTKVLQRLHHCRA